MLSQSIFSDKLLKKNSSECKVAERSEYFWFKRGEMLRIANHVEQTTPDKSYLKKFSSFRKKFLKFVRKNRVHSSPKIRLLRISPKIYLSTEKNVAHRQFFAQSRNTEYNWNKMKST